MMKKCMGEGQGTCRKCKQINWMCFLYKVEGLEGSYCYECAKELEKLKDGNNEQL